MTTKAQAKREARQEAIDFLREFIKPGDKVYCILRHVSSSGMRRIIDLYVIEDGEPRWIGGKAAEAMDEKYDRDKNGIIVNGVGMDMGFWLVYSLARTLFADDAEAGDAGYSLKHSWL